MTSQYSPVWRNDDLEGAVIGAFFLRGADPEVMDILATLPVDVFLCSSTGKFMREFVGRPVCPG